MSYSFPCVREVPLTQGKFALVDNEDYPLVMKYKWHFSKSTGYAYCKRLRKAMHQLILPTPRHLIADHIDNDGLNNTKANLRQVTASENGHNRKDKNVGVNWDSKRNRWRVRIKINYKDTHIGFFRYENNALEAYYKAREELGI
jgi:hypothetical protein